MGRRPEVQKPQLEKVVYSELLELCHELKWEVEEKSGSGQARNCRNLCLLLLYCAAKPWPRKRICHTEFTTIRMQINQRIKMDQITPIYQCLLFSFHVGKSMTTLLAIREAIRFRRLLMAITLLPCSRDISILN